MSCSGFRVVNDRNLSLPQPRINSRLVIFRLKSASDAWVVQVLWSRSDQVRHLSSHLDQKHWTLSRHPSQAVNPRQHFSLRDLCADGQPYATLSSGCCIRTLPHFERQEPFKRSCCKLLRLRNKMVSRAGLEPATLCLKVGSGPHGPGPFFSEIYAGRTVRPRVQSHSRNYRSYVNVSSSWLIATAELTQKLTQ